MLNPVDLLPPKGLRLTFKSIDEDASVARQQRDLLERINVNYRWISYAPKRDAEFRAAWREAIGISKNRRIGPECAPKGAGEEARSWIVLEPVLTTSRGKGQRSGAEAFLFVMVMSAIALA